MTYSIMLYDRKNEAYWYHDSILPGFVPDHVLAMMACDYVEKELDLCRLCDVNGARCHVIVDPDGKKLCPVLFADAAKPKWKVSQIA
jgi:hypothetical protein